MKFSIAQANLFYKGPANEILHSLGKVQPDILCTQETTVTSRYNPGFNIPQKIQDLGYTAAFFKPTLQKNGTIMGNGIFSKLPFLQTSFTDVQDEKPDSLKAFIENRKYLQILIDLGIGHAPLTIGTVHLSPPHRAELDFSDAKSVEDARFLAATCQQTGRFVLAGDLNATPDYPLVPQLLKQFENASPDLSLPTWQYVPIDATNDYDQAKDDQRVDYILATPDLEVVSTEFFDIFGSDHKGILTVFEV